MVTPDQLRRIMPNLKQDRLDAFHPHLQKAMTEFDVTSPAREAAFLAQLAHESGEFRWMQEIWGPSPAQKRYEPPSSLAARLGNTRPGDGKRYMGRGPIQVTGRDNYRRYGGLLGLDLEGNPEQAATPEVGFRIAGVFWHRNGLNELADKGWFKTITKRINGGFNGLDHRLKYYARAQEVLGAGARRTRGGPTDEDPEPILERGWEDIKDAAAADLALPDSEVADG